MLTQAQQRFTLMFIWKSRQSVSTNNIYSAMIGARGKLGQENTDGYVMNTRDVEQFLEHVIRKGIITPDTNSKKKRKYMPTMELHYCVTGVREMPFLFVK